jgi:Tol biopolymer transport system component
MLCVGDIQGTWTRIVNADCHEEFAWSPDSRSLAFSVLSQDNYSGTLQSRPKTTEIFTVGIDGSNEKCLLEKEGTWIVLDWSPDGQRLLLSRRDLQKGTGELFEFYHSDAYEAALNSDYDPHWNVKRAVEFLKPVKVDISDLQFNSTRYSPTRNEIACEVYDNKNMYAPRLPSETPESFRVRLLAKIYVADFESGIARKVADFDDGIRGPICWSPEGDEILFSRYLPKEDKRESPDTRDGNGLAIWAVGRDGENAQFITTGWSPDFASRAKNGKSTR